MDSLCKRMLLTSILAVGTGTSAAWGMDYKPAHHRNPPQVPNRSDVEGKTCPPRHDCRAPKRLRIVSIIPDDFPFKNRLSDFGNGIVGSNWLKELSAAYDIPGPATAIVIQVDDMPKLNGGKQQKVADYRHYVSKKARANGVEKSPQFQTLYLLYIPCDPDSPRAGMDGDKCSSHHPPISPVYKEDKLFVQGDSMAVVLRLNPKAKPDAPALTVDDFTGPASHELAEAATNTPHGQRFALHTDDPDHPYLDSGTNAGGTPWVRQSGGIELADMSEGTVEYESLPGDHHAFRFERIYSNKASKAGGDPAVPASGYPYFNVSTDEDWLTSSGGTIVRIPVTAWAASHMGDWDVDAKVSSWYRRTANVPVNAPCSLPKKHWSVHNGSEFDVRVATTAPHINREWCVVRLRSTKSQATDGDDFHEWFVGVIVKASPTPGENSDPCICANGTKAGPGVRADSPACEHICGTH